MTWQIAVSRQENWMMDVVTDFMRRRRIDSFQKLRFLLLLQQKPQLIATTQEFAAFLHLGDEVLLKKIIRELQIVGLVECLGDRCKLFDEAEIRLSLQQLARAYEDPLNRQKILANLDKISSVDYDRDTRDLIYV
jgi:hypothetical protein